MWESPKFSARAFGARKLRFLFGRGTRQNVFCWVTLAHFDFRLCLALFECILGHFFQILDVKIPKFSARAFGARRLRFVFGRGTRRKWVVFYWVTLVHFHFRVCFAPFECIFGHSSGFRCENPKNFSSRLRRSQTKICFWSGYAPKMSGFLLGDFGAFSLSCVFRTFWVHIWAFFRP